MRQPLSIHDDCHCLFVGSFVVLCCVVHLVHGVKSEEVGTDCNVT